MKKIVAVIPARKGSKGISKKNIRLLGGHPLIAYSICAALLSNLIEQVIVTTDCQETADISKKYGAEVPFLRPSEISQDLSTDIKFFKHLLSYCKDQKLSEPDLMVHLRPTTPLRIPKIIDEAIQKLISDSNATSLRSVYESPLTPYKIFQLEKGYLKGFFPNDSRLEYYNLPRQQFPRNYIGNGYIDIVKSSTISHGSLHGGNILAYITEKVPDIDALEDFKYAENVFHEGKFKELINFINNNFNNL